MVTIEEIKNIEKQLRPCPFCGKRVRIAVFDWLGNGSSNIYYENGEIDNEYLEKISKRGNVTFGVVHPKDEFCK